MKKSLLLLLVISLTFSYCKKVNKDCNLNTYPLAPNKSWFTSHNGTQEEAHGHFMLYCSDGGFLQVGETGSFPNAAKILVVKTNSSGGLIWKKEIGNLGQNLGNSALEQEDAYLIAGSLGNNSALIKLNKNNGQIIFQNTYNQGGVCAFEQAIVTQKQIIAVGYHQAQDNSNTFYTQGEGLLTFINLDGNQSNSLSLNSYLSQGYRIKKIQNHFFIAGLTHDAQNYGLIKIDSSGNVIWAKEYGGTGADHCFGMDVDLDGHLYLTGHTLSGTENWDTYTLKINSNGSVIWESKQGNPRGFNPKYIHDEAWGIRATEDGGCLVVAGTGDEYRRYKRKCGENGDNSSTWHVYLIKMDACGQVEWQKTYGGEAGQDWAGEDIHLTADGGAIVAVDNGQFGFLKIDPFQ